MLKKKKDDSRLGHDGARHRLLDAADQKRVGHARDAAVAADVVLDALDRFDGCCFFFSSRRRHTRYWRDWSSDVCSSDLRSEKPLIGRSPEVVVKMYGP